jgi:hypothetical protein
MTSPVSGLKKRLVASVKPFAALVKLIEWFCVIDFNYHASKVPASPAQNR